MIAQGVTNMVTWRACLPPERRLLPSQAIPRSPPLWASILGDVWALYTDDDDDDEVNREAV